MKPLLAIVVCLLMTPRLPAQGHSLNRTLTHEGAKRDFVIYVPTSYSADKAMPLVLAFHGMFGSANQMMNTSGFNAVAEQEGFLVAYPNANELQGWAAGKDHNVGYVDAVLLAIEKEYNVDSSRIYAAGMSQGGIMCYILAVSRDNKFAAIASVGGIRVGIDSKNLFPLSVKNIPVRQVPLLHMHGTADMICPYKGGEVELPGVGKVPFPSTLAVIADWAANNGGMNLGPETRINDIFAADGEDGSSSTVSVFEYRGCAPYIGVSGKRHVAEVVHYRINGGGHSWSVLEHERATSIDALTKGLSDELVAMGGPVNSDISASAEIWKFFRRHELAAGTEK